MALGIEGLDQVGVPVRRREYRTGNGRLLFAMDEAAFWADGPGSLCVRRNDVLRLLRTGLREDRVRWGTHVTSVENTDQSALVGLADGRTRGGPVDTGGSSRG
jgi:2-polyprenyl-6-methoxyphenol hydroxylase-like FAD-dependent oxidoreductase